MCVWGGGERECQKARRGQRSEGKGAAFLGFPTGPGRELCRQMEAGVRSWVVLVLPPQTGISSRWVYGVRQSLPYPRLPASTGGLGAHPPRRREEPPYCPEQLLNTPFQALLSVQPCRAISLPFTCQAGHFLEIPIPETAEHIKKGALPRSHVLSVNASLKFRLNEFPVLSCCPTGLRGAMRRGLQRQQGCGS